jgi:PadR family transcriptional regulator PadR
LYPALHRLVRKGWLAAEWKDTPKGRPMKFYRLTPAGRRQLIAEESNWQQLCRAIGLVLKRA